MLKSEGDIETLKKKLLEKDYDIAHHQNRCKEFEEAMRSMTSVSNMADNDDTFEAVLRNEF